MRGVRELELNLTIGVHNLVAALVLAAPVIGLALRRRLAGSPPVRVSYPLARLLQPALSRRGRLRGAVLAAALVALTVGLLSPTATVEREVTVQASGEVQAAYQVARPAVILVMDVSGSMGEQIPGGVKIEAAREAALRFVEGVPGDVDVGLIAFSDRVESSVPPTGNRSELEAAIRALMATGGTMYSYPLMSALAWVRGYRAFNATCAVVMLTDGLPADRSEYRHLLGSFRELGVPIHTVFIGVPGSEGEEETRLIARETGGTQHTVATVRDLLDTLSNLSSQVSETVATARFSASVKVPVRTQLDLGWPMIFAGIALYCTYWVLAQREEGTRL